MNINNLTSDSPLATIPLYRTMNQSRLNNKLINQYACYAGLDWPIVPWHRRMPSTNTTQAPPGPLMVILPVITSNGKC